MSNYIDADRLTAFVKARRDLHYKYFVKNGVGCIAEYKYDEDVELLDFITSLQQEQSEPPSLIEKAIVWFNNIAESAKRLSAGNVSHLAPTIAGMAIRSAEFLEKREHEQPKQKKKCNNCPHCVDRKDQNGWHFKGCFGGPYKGKFIAEIDECPLQQSEVDLEKEIKNYLATECAADDEPCVSEVARHFYELGFNARKEE